VRSPQHPGLLLHEIFEAQAQRWPNRAAVEFGSRTATYAELNARANQLARYLRARAVGRGAAVAMLLPRSIEAYTSILGILKAGAAYVPIDPEYPPDRIAWILADSGACALLTNSDLAARSQVFSGPAILIDVESDRIAVESSEDLPRDEESAHPEDLCYVIYTSGSTGRPKGVMVEHRNVCHLVQTESRIFGMRRDDRVYQGAPLCFDLSVEEIWLAFGVGATLVAATPEMAHAGPDLARQLARCGVTVLSCVPTLLSLMDGGSEDLPALRLLIVGGETCSKHLVERWARPGRRIVNTYGPTETTVIATWADVCPGRPVTIGRPLPGYSVYVLDDRLQPVPPGETGEICIAGAGVARGYRGLLDETRARFVACGERRRRMYRSGDLGRINSAGNLEFMGRADEQVKLRGLRVELGEIESVLLRDESVGAAACAVRDQQLVCCVIPRNQSPVNEERLRSQLKAWLPAWMVPARIEMVPDLPRLPSGKLDRALLGVHRRLMPAVRTAIPGDSTEHQLMEVWSALFDTSQISVDDDFFLDLGGHSLLAAQMVSELRKHERFASLTMRDVYSHPTISSLATEINRRVKSGDTTRRQRADHRVRHFLAGAIQTVSLYFVFGFRGVQWIAPWLVYFLLLNHLSALKSAVWALAGGVAVLPVLILLAVCAKWILLGRVRPGRHPLWGGYYLRWWFVQTLVQSVPLTRLGGTPLLPFVYRLFGVRVGKDVHISSDLLAAFDVTSIG